MDDLSTTIKIITFLITAVVNLMIIIFLNSIGRPLQFIIMLMADLLIWSIVEHIHRQI